LDGPGTKQAFVDSPAHVNVHVKDADGKPYDLNPEWLQVSCDSQDKTPATTSALKKEPKTPGTYAGTFTPTKAGKHSINASAFGQPLLKEPVVVQVSSGPSAEKCEVSGIPNPAHCGEPIVATISPKDSNGKPLSVGGIPFKAKVKNPDKTESPLPINDKGDGTYGLTFTPTKPGDYQLDVQLNDTNLKNTPVKFDVEEDALPESSEYDFTPVVQCSLRVRALNHKGEPRVVGGDAVAVDVSGDEKPLSVNVQDHKDGTYTVQWHAHPGHYKVAVKIRGRHVKGSPFKYHVPNIQTEQF